MTTSTEAEPTTTTITPSKTKTSKFKTKRAPTDPTQKRKPFYLTSAVLLKEVIHAKELGIVTDKLARMLMLLAERYSRKSSFAGYSFREDMVSTALINLCVNGLKFNPERSSNPFAFYTTAIHNSFLQYMADEKKHRNIRDGLIVEAGSNPSFSFTDSSGETVERSKADPFNNGVGEIVTGRGFNRLPGECVVTSYVVKVSEEIDDEILAEYADGIPDDEITEAVIAELPDLLVFDAD